MQFQNLSNILPVLKKSCEIISIKLGQMFDCLTMHSLSTQYIIQNII